MGRMPWGDEGKDHSDASASQGMPKSASKPPDAQGTDPLSQPGKSQPSRHLDLGLLVVPNRKNSCTWR